MTVAPQAALAAAAAESPNLRDILDEVLENTRRSNALNPLEGTLTERLAYWNVTNPAWAQAGLNGWDSSSKCLVACSMADGLNVHPALFMQGNWCFTASGSKLIVIPKVPFMLALCRARVPGFRMEIVEDSDDACAVKMHNGREEHTYRYTMADAKRQRLLEGKGAWQNNQREMLQWKAVRRCADLACPEIMFGLSPAPEDAQSPEDEAPATVAVPEMPLAKPEPVPAQKEPDWIDVLRTEIRARWGTTSGKKMLEVSNLIAKDIGLEAFKAATDITPGSARRMVGFLREKYGLTGRPEATGSKAPVGAEGGTDAAAPRDVEVERGEAADATTGRVTDDPAPPAKPFDERHADEEEGVPLDFGDAPPTDVYADTDVRMLLRLVDKAAEDKPKVVFVKNAPNQVVFVHGPILRELGFAMGVVLVKDGAQRVEPELCARLVKAMRMLGVVDAPART